MDLKKNIEQDTLTAATELLEDSNIWELLTTGELVPEDLLDDKADILEVNNAIDILEEFYCLLIGE